MFSIEQQKKAIQTMKDMNQAIKGNKYMQNRLGIRDMGDMQDMGDTRDMRDMGDIQDIQDSQKKLLREEIQQQERAALEEKYAKAAAKKKEDEINARISAVSGVRTTVIDRITNMKNNYLQQIENDIGTIDSILADLQTQETEVDSDYKTFINDINN